MPFFQDESSDQVYYGGAAQSSYGKRPEPHQSMHLRAEDNLSYLDFIRLVQYLWQESHPDIPFYGEGAAVHPKYPCVVYSLDMRRPFSDEPKMRHREVIRTNTDEQGVVIYGQRFASQVAFAVYAEQAGNGIQEAEELIETFEDFMIEFTGVFKRLGLSDLAYGRRLPDTVETRRGTDLVKRTVMYQVVTEKLIQTTVWKLNQMIIAARAAFSTATPTITAEAAATPSFAILDGYGDPV